MLKIGDLLVRAGIDIQMSSPGMLLLFGVAAMLLTSAECQGTDLSNVRFPLAASLKAGGAGLDAGIAGLATTLRRHLSTRADGNAVLSPLSIGVVLAALQMGAHRSTAQEIGQLLGQGSIPIQAYWAELGGALRAINASKAVIAETASAIFVDSSFALSAGYKQNVRNVLASEEFTVDFSGHKFSALDTVNNWVALSTHDRIPRILDDISSDAVLVVASAVYFNGAWEKPFPATNTRRENFYVTSEEVRTVDMMSHSAQLPYAHSSDLRCKVLGLLYKGREFAMYILLPDDKGEKALQRLEAELTPASLLELLESAVVDDVVIFMLPRFTLEASFSLKEPLQASGVKALFDPSQADLSGLVAHGKVGAARQGRLAVSDVVHRVRVEVTETGTEAVAATAAWVTRTAHPVVRADRPFMFVIQHLPTRTLLFWGSVVRP